MPLLDLFWTILYIFLLFAWIWLLISVFGDIFRSDLSGWGKAGWTIFVVLLPFLGVLIYLIVHGGDMQDRNARDAIAADAAQREYIRSVAGGSASTADELGKLAALRDQGVISEQDFDAQKAKLLA
jgi:hypothetical protein